MQNIFEKLITLLSTHIPLSVAKLFHRLGLSTQYQPLPHISLIGGSYSERIAGRLSAIKENLSDDLKVGMDIGCNNGFYVFSIAETGRWMCGVEGDNNVFQIFLAAKRKFTPQNVTPINQHVTIENVDFLPECDFMICMAVFHHWARHYGEKNALEILKTLLNKTRKTVFLEIPFANESGSNYKDVLPDRGAENSEMWWKEWLLEQGWTNMTPIYEKGRILYRVER